MGREEYHEAMDATRSRPPGRTRTQRVLDRIADGDGVGDRGRADALSRPCPVCHAVAHRACVSPKGELRWAFHRERRHAPKS